MMNCVNDGLCANEVAMTIPPSEISGMGEGIDCSKQYTAWHVILRSMHVVIMYPQHTACAAVEMGSSNGCMGTKQSALAKL